MQCIERTLWLVIWAVIYCILCQAAPSEDQRNSRSNLNSSRETLPEAGVPGDLRVNRSLPIEFETETKSVGRLNLDAPQLRLPVHAGPGNYLEDRRRLTENRIQELENQVNLLLEAQTEEGGQTPDPEQESRTAIQYGLNCERGETVLVCLMKKVVLLRKEVSGIQRDVSDIGKKVLLMANEIQVRHANERDEGTMEDRNSGQEPDSAVSENDNVTSTNVTERPFEGYPQQDPLCPPSFERVGNICYYVVTDQVKGVASASNFCESHGGYLARPRDSLTIHDLTNHLTRLHDKGYNQLSELWVDGHYKAKEETWRWSDGKQIDRSVWGISNTPAKTHDMDKCVLLKKELNYLAMPQDCGYHYFFVCQAETRDDIPAM